LFYFSFAFPVLSALPEENVFREKRQESFVINEKKQQAENTKLKT